jgi:hypothetical protein
MQALLFPTGHSFPIQLKVNGIIFKPTYNCLAKKYLKIVYIAIGINRVNASLVVPNGAQFSDTTKSESYNL